MVAKQLGARKAKFERGHLWPPIQHGDIGEISHQNEVQPAAQDTIMEKKEMCDMTNLKNLQYLSPHEQKQPGDILVECSDDYVTICESIHFELGSERKKVGGVLQNPSFMHIFHHQT